MGELILSAPISAMTAKNRIAGDDVLMLRGEIFADGVVTRAEAETLFALDASCDQKCAEWTPFFCEAVADYLVHQESPTGYISAENADWLIRSISRDGKVDTATEMELLVRVLEIARSAPENLGAYALEQVAHAVIDGEGPLADSRRLQRGVIGRAETDLIRRILYANSGNGGAGISQREADILFRLNDSADETANDSSWAELFVKALASSVMCASGYTPPPREVALRQEIFFNDHEADVAGFFGRMLAGGLRGVLNAYKEDTASDSKPARHKETDPEVITACEAEWLVERIRRDGKIQESEKALLAFIRDEAPSIHPQLKMLIDEVA